MTLIKQAKTLQSFSQKASLLVQEKNGVDTSIPRIFVFFEDKWKERYLEVLKESEKSSCSKIVALDSVLREIKTTMADEWARNYSYLGYCTIYSTRLDEEIIVCRDDMVAKIIKEEKRGIPIYVEKELEQLKDITNDELRNLHDAHTIYTGMFIDPTDKPVGKNHMRNNGTKAQVRFGQAKKKNSKYSRFKKSNPS